MSTQQAETYQIIYRLISLYTPHVTAENHQALISSEVHITNRVLAVYDIIYLLTAIGLSPGGSAHLHTNNT